jgi:hypothetical protein
MENANNNCTHNAAEAASAVPGESTSALRPGQGLPLEFLVPCLADLKRQIALRQAMP